MSHHTIENMTWTFVFGLALAFVANVYVLG